MAAYFWIALGSALGGVGRYAAGVWSAEWLGVGFPWGTLIVNVLGSFVIGVFAALSAQAGPVTISENARLFVTVGLCGGFTTFSAFSLQTLNLMQAGVWVAAAANIAGSVVLCLVAVWAGYALAGVVAR
ncbi:MAG: fluoride efflux transporter CrcB [Rhodospirillaceae bacterium]|nr:fluoride efflux transporter CrcB [Rhodospirillaceae bacterium]